MRLWQILILCIVIMLSACITLETGSIKIASDQNREACQDWCEQHKDCDRCSRTLSCGDGYEVIKSWTKGRDWYACKQIKGGDNTKSSSTAKASSTHIVLQRKPVVVKEVKSVNTKSSSTAKASSTAIALQRKQVVMAPIKPVTSYSFFANAKKAKWKSVHGPVTLGKKSCSRGCVFLNERGRISPSGNGKNMVVMYLPLEKKNTSSYVEGVFPATLIGENVKFKSTAAFLKGTNTSDGALFTVYVIRDKKRSIVTRQKVKPDRMWPIQADLSKYQNQLVRLVLQVHCNGSTKYDRTAWLSPRLTTE